MTQVVWTRADNGSDVPLLNEVSCHSLRDPLEEANIWCERVRPFINDSVREVIVLGGGAGYHIEALLNQIRFRAVRVIVLEHHPQLASFIRARFVADSIQVVDVNSYDAFMRLRSQIIGTSACCILSFQPIAQLDSFYQTCSLSLLSQTTVTFHRELQTRGMKIEFDFESVHGQRRHPGKMALEQVSGSDLVAAATLELFR